VGQHSGVFISDNGSEFIHRKAAGLWNKLLIEQTKTGPRRSNDNGLVESTSGAVVRKPMGDTHIAAHHGDEIASFYQERLNPYMSFHRPCGMPELVANAKREGCSRLSDRGLDDPAVGATGASHE
jgi:hypothetical protein